MGGMNRIRVIAVVLSMVLLLLGASGNTNDETRNKADSYESESQEETKAQPAGLIIAEAGETYIEEIRQAEAEAARIAEAEAAEAARIAEEAARIAEIEAAGADMEYVEALEEEREAEAMARRVVQVSEEDYTALIKLVEAEASGEDIKGRMLVANVVINRLEAGRFGSSIKEVIYQRVDGRAVARAPNWLTSPSASGSLATERRIPLLMVFHWINLVRIVINTWVPSRRKIIPQPHT